MKSLYKAAVLSCVKATNEGFKAMAVDDVKEGKLQETLDDFKSCVVHFIQ